MKSRSRRKTSVNIPSNGDDEDSTITDSEKTAAVNKAVGKFKAPMKLKQRVSIMKNDQEKLKKDVELIKQKQNIEVKIMNHLIQQGNISVKCAFWNLLAHGMANGEFLCPGGDNDITDWHKRGERTREQMGKMMSENDIVCTVENDRCISILNHLRSNNPNIKCIYLLKIKPSAKDVKLSTAKYNGNYDSNYDSNQKYEGKPSWVLEDNGNYSNARKLAFGDPKNLSSTNNQIVPYGITYKNECGEYASFFAELYSANEDNYYSSDDGLAVYYNSKEVDISDIDYQYYELLNKEDQNVPIKIYKPILRNGNKEYCNFLPVRFRKNNIEFTIICGHLTSGEEADKEKVRMNEFNIMNKEINEKEYPQPIFLIDSNTSEQYLNSFNKLISSDNTLYKTFDDSGYESIINEDIPDFKCFKMRHAKGQQPEKFGELMYDTIDKCLIKKDRDFLIRPVNLLDESIFLNANDSDLISKFRNDKIMRGKIKKFMFKYYYNNKTIDDLIAEINNMMEGMKVSVEDKKITKDDETRIKSIVEERLEIDTNTYNINLGLNKEKNKIDKIIINNKETSWGDDVNKIEFNGLYDYIYNEKYKDDNEVIDFIIDENSPDQSVENATNQSVKHKLINNPIEDNKLKMLFQKIYPNTKLASDHPPIGVEILFYLNNTEKKLINEDPNYQWRQKYLKYKNKYLALKKRL